MNIETSRFKIEAATAFGAGFILTQKRHGGAPAWHMFLSEAPSVSYLATISESRFNREAAEAMESGAWN